MCEKSFRDRSELNRHSRRHTGDLPYKCQTCGKGFLRRERFVTHTRIHTGEKPFVCGVCNRGYRDKRELKKHQATHNHGDPNEPPTTAQQVVMAPSPSTQHVTVVPSPAAPRNTKPVQVQVQQPASATSASQMATITFSLPTEPVPKNQLGIQQQAEQQYVQPLNPAQITLPPSVASALQNLNQKAKPSSSSAMVAVANSPQPPPPPPQQQSPAQTQSAVKQEHQMQILKQIQVVDMGEGQQLQLAGGSLASGIVAGSGSASQPQLFYCIVPPSAMQSYAVEGGSIRVATSESATPQLVTLAPGAFQAAQLSGASGIPINKIIHIFEF